MMGKYFTIHFVIISHDLRYKCATIHVFPNDSRQHNSVLMSFFFSFLALHRKTSQNNCSLKKIELGLQSTLWSILNILAQNCFFHIKILKVGI